MDSRRCSGVILRLGGLVLSCIAPAVLAQQAAEAPESTRASEEPNAGTKGGESAPIDGIRDNSFLIEEAYNQEAGVVQHIFGGLLANTGDDREFNFTFVQEWPVFSQTHQFSYSLPANLPVAFLGSESAGYESGLSDVQLNYRYQVSLDEGACPAFAPRLSLIIPTGDVKRDLGTGVPGYQINLPFSKTLNDRLYVNLNAGFTYFPDAGFEFSNGRRPHDRDLLHFNLAASAIYALRRDVHLLLEAAANFQQEFKEFTTTEGGRPRVKRPRTNEVVLSPGIRWAINLPDDLQIVSGLAFPIGVSDDAMDYGVFLYFSIEHPFVRRATN